MAITIETVPYRGWTRNIRIANREVELIVTQEVGPRILRFGFIGGPNILGELPDQLGGAGEGEWKIRGGHRLWIAPEAKPKSYELDNGPVAIRPRSDGIRAQQAPGPMTRVAKTMEVALAERRNVVTVTHRLTNRGRKPIALSVWALTVMTKRGTAVIPLPAKIAHTARLTHNQEWSLWGYTDFSDPRWTLGSRYLRFRQDPKRGPNKMGIAHREGWVGYLYKDLGFIKRFSRIEGAPYPDGGVNFETFANEDILELESLGPLVTLAPGRTATHTEIWSLHRRLPACRTEQDLDRVWRPLALQK